MINASISVGGDMYRTSYQHLLNLIGNDGKFIYKYDIDNRQISPKYNILRHSGCIWALNTFREGSSQDNRVDVAKTYLANCTSSPANGVGRCLPEGEVVKIGANALALLAFLTSEHPEVYADLINSYVEYILSQQKEDLDFVHKVDRNTGQDLNFNSQYYTGEVLFALMEYSRIFNNDEVRAIALKALIARLDDDYGIPQHSHWMMYAVRSAFQQTSHDATTSYTKRFIENLVQNDAYRSWGRGTPVACRTEALLLPSISQGYRAYWKKTFQL